MFPTQSVQALQRERQVCAAGARGTAGNRGESLQIRTVLSPASFSHPGSVTVNMCLLALPAIAPIRDRVLSSEPQEQGTKLGELVLGCLGSHTGGSGVGERAASPAPARDLFMGRARQSH